MQQHIKNFYKKQEKKKENLLDEIAAIEEKMSKLQHRKEFVQKQIEETESLLNFDEQQIQEYLAKLSEEGRKRRESSTDSGTNTPGAAPDSFNPR